MSKTTNIILTAVAAAALLTACNKKLPGQKTSSDLQTEANQMAAAIQTGKPVKCTITRIASDQYQASRMEYYIKGDKIMMTGVEIEGSDQEQGAMISDGEFVYVWDEMTKEGFKFPAVDPAEAQEAANQAANNAPEVPDFSQENVQQEYEDQGYDLDCDQANISDDEFVPPTDVAFQDFSAMMESYTGSSGISAEQKAAMEEVLKQAQQ